MIDSARTGTLNAVLQFGGRREDARKQAYRALPASRRSILTGAACTSTRFAGRRYTTGNPRAGIQGRCRGGGAEQRYETKSPPGREMDAIVDKAM